MRLSYSTIKGLLDNCAYQTANEKIRKDYQAPHPRAASGTAFHAAVEAHEKARQVFYLTDGRAGFEDGLSRLEMQAAADEAFQAEVDEVDWDKWEEENDWTPEHFEQEYLSAIDNWWDGEIPADQPGAGSTPRDRVLAWEPILVEPRFKLWTPAAGPSEVVGSPDAIYYDRSADEHIIVDHKSAKNYNRYGDTTKLRGQASFYVMANRTSAGLVGWLMPDRTPRFEFHVVRTTTSNHGAFQPVRVLSVQIDNVDLKHTEERIRTARSMVDKGSFPKNPHSHFCDPRWCGFHKDAGGFCDPDKENEHTFGPGGRYLGYTGNDSTRSST